MAYEITDIEPTKEKVVNSFGSKKIEPKQYSWWMAEDEVELAQMVLSTAEFLKRTNATRIRQASLFTRMLSGKPLYNYLASNSALDTQNSLPIGRPTANVCYSCTDTLVSLISQDRPKPVFITDNGHYKERKLAKEANAFIQGELYRLEAYGLATDILEDACALGDGFLKIGEKDNKVSLERVLETELLVDFNDGYYRAPRQLGHLKLVDRSVVAATLAKKEAAKINSASKGNVDSTPRSTETVSDQIILCEFWHLPSSEDADDGRHVIVCTEGVILDEPYHDQDFPFVQLSYHKNRVGFFSQGLIEILMPTQMEIYRMLITASQAIELMGVPRFYIDEMSKIVESHFNNRIGSIIKGRGTPPVVLNATANTPEIYQWIEFLISNAYNMSGISSMAAQAKKTPGLNSGEAIREANDLQSARFAALERRYQNLFVSLSYKIISKAKQIAEREGSYETVFPGKDGIRKVDFKSISRLNDNYVVQMFEESSLPKDPEGRQAKLSEMLAAGEITNQEFRRLSNFPDLEQSDQLATALEERILHALDEIVDNGDKNYAEIAPDQYILDPTNLASTLCINYINLYSTLQLEEEKLQVLRNWNTQVLGLVSQVQQQAATQQAQMQMAAQQQAAQQQAQSQLPPTQPPAAPIGPASGSQV